MNDKRTYPRETLTAAMICECEAGGCLTHGLVKNISLDGVLLECPKAEEMELLDIGDKIVLRDILLGPKALLQGAVGEVVWLYKRMIGLHFRETLMESPEALRTWLEERNLV